MRVTIIGLGLIGGSVALDLKKVGFAQKIIGVDHNLTHCQQALELGFVDQVMPLKTAMQCSDLVILAIPVNNIVEILPSVLDLALRNTTVTDMGSTKELICRVVRNHKGRQQFIPSHPMAGTENSGPSAALHGLFKGKAAIICDADQSSEIHLNRVIQLYSVLQMRIIFMSSIEHDLHTAYVSHLSHLLSFALANTVLNEEKNTNTIFDLAGGGFESTVRLAKSSSEMWLPIFEQNSEFLLSALESYMKELEKFKKCLVERRFDEVQTLITKSNQIRRVLQSIHREKQ